MAHHAPRLMGFPMGHSLTFFLHRSFAKLGWLGRLCVLACAVGFGPGVIAQGLLPIPPLTARVIDQTGTLGAADKQALEAKLAAFEQQKG